MERSEDPDAPIRANDRFAVELARFLEGRVDPSRNVQPPGNPPLDVMACLQAQAELDRIVG
jgi:hypothetical protein